MTATPSQEWTPNDERVVQQNARATYLGYGDEFVYRLSRAFLRQRDEVARLRAENAALVQTRRQLNSVIATIATWRSENERLREMVSAYRKELSERALELIELASLRAENERLMEWQSSVLGRLEAMPEFRDATWAGDKRGWGFVFEFVGWMHREIKSLRSQLAATREGETPNV